MANYMTEVAKMLGVELGRDKWVAFYASDEVLEV